MIVKIDYTSRTRTDDEGCPVYYETKNPLFKNLPQYHFDRGDMCSVFDTDFMHWFWDHIEEESDEFRLTRVGDEFYIIHFPSGTIVNWYKHMGRTNTCNKNLTLDDLREFKKMLLESFGYEEKKMREITLEDCHKLKTHHFDKYCETAEQHEFPILAMVGVKLEQTLEKWGRTGIPSQKEARAMFRAVLKVTGGDASEYTEPEY